MAEGNGEDLERRLDRLEAENQMLKEKVEEMGPSEWTRRGVLGALGVGGLALASGSAAADGPTSGETGTIGSGNVDWDVQDLTATTISSEQILGSVAGNDTITNLVGTNLSVDADGNLNASGGGGSSGPSAAHLPITSIADGSFVEFVLYVASGQTLDLTGWGARTDAKTTPSGLTMKFVDGSGTTLASDSTAYSSGSPIASVSGADDVRLQLENTTGGSVNAGAVFEYSRD